MDVVDEDAVAKKVDIVDEDEVSRKVDIDEDMVDVNSDDEDELGEVAEDVVIGSSFRIHRCSNLCASATLSRDHRPHTSCLAYVAHSSWSIMQLCGCSPMQTVPPHRPYHRRGTQSTSI